MFVSNEATKAKYINDKIHESNLEDLKNNNGVILDYGLVEFSDLNIGPGRPHQSRAKGEDPTHVSFLQNSIQVNGLQTLPIVETSNGKYNVISGHHRILACKKLNWKQFPVALVKFPNPLSRAHFKRDVQIHLPSKNHNTLDHISYLSEVDTLGEFDNCESEKAVKEHAKKLLKKAVGDTQLTKIVNQWFDSRGFFTGVRNLNRVDVKKWSDEIWKISSFTAKGKKKMVFRPGMQHPVQKNTILITSCFNAINKALYNVMRMYAEEEVNPKKTSIQRRIEMAVYCDRSNSPTSLTNTRQHAIKQYTAHNICFGNSALIEKVVILPQIQQSGNYTEIPTTLSWDAAQKKFV